MLTQKQIDGFHRDGFLRIPQVFQGEELALLRAAADDVTAAGIARQGDDHVYENIDGRETYYRSEMMWNRDDIFRAVTVKPELLAAIGQCYGEAFLPLNDSYVCKTPRSMVPILWHQDPPYADAEAHPLTQSTPNFDTDIYLDHSTIENGCVWGISGHHLVGNVQIEGRSQEEMFEEHGAVPIEMEPGDVLFHCISAPHGSVGNPTDSIRRIFYIHYMAYCLAEQVCKTWQGTPKSGRGWSEQGFDLTEDMLAARDRLGLKADLAASNVCYERDTGFYFHAYPRSPYKHWGTLLREMDAEEIEAKKALRFQ